MAVKTTVPVRFARVTLPYAPGEVAHFSRLQAEHFVKIGAALFVDAKGKPCDHAVEIDQPARVLPALQAASGKEK